MEALGVAASVIAVIQITSRIAQLCVDYHRAVKDARGDIIRLQSAVTSLKEVLEEVQRLINGPHGAKLASSQTLLKTITECLEQLANMDTKLKPSKGRKTLNRLGLRELKWPFEGAEIEKIVAEAMKYRETILLGLQVDQTYVSFLLRDTLADAMRGVKEYHD